MIKTTFDLAVLGDYLEEKGLPRDPNTKIIGNKVKAWSWSWSWSLSGENYGSRSWLNNSCSESARGSSYGSESESESKTRFDAGSGSRSGCWGGSKSKRMV